MRKNGLHKKYNKALLRSEQRRVEILLAIFSLSLVFRVIGVWLPGTGEKSIPGELLSVLWLFPAAIILFELLSLVIIKRRLRQKKQVPFSLQLLNALLEVFVPSAVIFSIAREFSSFNVLESPVIFIYFIYIILSTLRLNFILSALYGLLAALTYSVFSIVLYDQLTTDDAGRALILFFAGIAAGLVARQIKSGIEKSLEEAEKRKSAENLFSQQISPEVATQLLANGGQLESKRMNVAVLFIDIENFTHFTLDKTPEEIVRYQNSFFTIVINTINRHGGIVNQILGDGCMVTFGAPLPHLNPSEPAVNAARELLTDLDTAISSRQLPLTKIRIGIHTGEAVTGNIGNRERQQYSITGGVVILASRIEQLNKELGSRILVSEDVMNRIHDTAVIAELCGPFFLKGFENPVTVYKLA